MALSSFTVTIITKSDSPFNVIPSAPIEIRERLANGSSGNLSLIFSDQAGLNPITQVGFTTDSLGQAVFFAAAADYNAVYDNNGTPVTIAVDVGVTGGILNERFDRLNPATLQIAIDDETLQDEDVLNVEERSTGSAGGAFWIAVLASSVTTNGLDIVQCVGAPLLALVLRVDDGIIRANQLGATFDGDTDDTLALQAAIDLMTVENNDLRFPVGTAIFSRLTLPEHLRIFKIRGEGKDSTILKTAITTGVAITGTWPDEARANHSVISGFTVIGEPLGAAAGFELAGFSFSDFIKLRVDDFLDCVRFNSQCFGVNIDSCAILHYSGTGIKQGNFNHWMTVNRVQFSSSRGNVSVGFLGIGAETVTNEALAITNCDFESSSIGVQLRNGGSPLIQSCYFENNTDTHLRLGFSDRTLVNPSIDNCYFNGNAASFPGAKCIDWANFVEGGSITNPHFLFDAVDQAGVVWNAGDRRDPKKSPVFTGFDQSFVENTGDTKNTANFIGRELIEVDDADLLLGWVSRVISTINGQLTITKVNGVVHVSAIISGGTLGTIFTLPDGFHPKTGQPVPVGLGLEGSGTIPTDLTLFIKRNGQVILQGVYDGTSQVNINTTYIPNVLG